MTSRLSPVTGIGLRSKHLHDFIALRPPLQFVEVHTENHLCGGSMRNVLFDIREDYGISLHCVGMSIGSAQPLNIAHVRRVRALVDAIDPLFVSDHLSVSTLDGVFANDLLPLPYTEEALGVVCGHVAQIQNELGRQVLVENPSRYAGYRHTTMNEGAFMGEMARATGCGILLDVNNVYVSARNMSEDPLAALRTFPASLIHEIHLAGHDTVSRSGETLRIDTHDRLVDDDVWALFDEAISYAGRQPTLIEWDDALPELSVLLDEAAKASQALGARSHCARTPDTGYAVTR